MAGRALVGRRQRAAALAAHVRPAGDGNLPDCQATQELQAR